MTVTYAPALIAAKTVATSCYVDRSSSYRGNNRPDARKRQSTPLHHLFSLSGRNPLAVHGSRIMSVIRPIIF